MNIFEQLRSADIMLVNGIPVTNYGWDDDDDANYWVLSIYGYDAEGRNNFEYYFSYDIMENAEQRGESEWLVSDPDSDNRTLIEFCHLVPVTRTTS